LTDRRLHTASATHVGQVRSRNEDACRVVSTAADRALVVVADGMGGHSAGDVASQMAIDLVCAYYEKLEDLPPAERLRRSAEEANRYIVEAAQTHAAFHRMGTTVVAVALEGDTAYVANVGDSRLYLLRAGHLHQVTKDHSWVALQVELGELTPEEAKTSRYRSTLLRCLGERDEVHVDIFTFALCDGDRLLACSDGLHGLVERAELIEGLVGANPAQQCAAFIDLANQRGGHDNITVAVVHVAGAPQDASNQGEQGSPEGCEQGAGFEVRALPGAPGGGSLRPPCFPEPLVSLPSPPPPQPALPPAAAEPPPPPSRSAGLRLTLLGALAAALGVGSVQLKSQLNPPPSAPVSRGGPDRGLGVAGQSGVATPAPIRPPVSVPTPAFERPHEPTKMRSQRGLFDQLQVERSGAWWLESKEPPRRLLHQALGAPPSATPEEISRSVRGFAVRDGQVFVLEEGASELRVFEPKTKQELFKIPLLPRDLATLGKGQVLMAVTPATPSGYVALSSATSNAILVVPSQAASDNQPSFVLKTPSPSGMALSESSLYCFRVGEDGLREWPLQSGGSDPRLKAPRSAPSERLIETTAHPELLCADVLDLAWSGAGSGDQEAEILLRSHRDAAVRRIRVPGVVTGIAKHDDQIWWVTAGAAGQGYELWRGSL
jgi:PPM family protein phosphatase